MIRVLLINQNKIPHYRISIYSYLSSYLEHYGFELIIVSGGIQSGKSGVIEFRHKTITLSTINLLRFISRENIEIIIFWVNLKYLYLFPTLLISKIIFQKKIIYWGHGRDLIDIDSRLKNIAYNTQHVLSDAMILYAHHLKTYIPNFLHKKVFVANNTLCINYEGLKLDQTKKNVLLKYGIHTNKNIICIGRIQKRKRIENLVRAFTSMNRSDVGLILVGPDPDGILNKFESNNLYKLGPIYGNDKFDLLSSADVYCLPGALGLSIVDAFYCKLPIVTENGDMSPEIMYLKDGINGFIVPRNNVEQLAANLQLLLDNDVLRNRFSRAAKKEIMINGNIDMFCIGFRDALRFVWYK